MRALAIIVLLAAVARAEPPPWCGTFARHELTPVRGLFEASLAPPRRQVTVDVSDLRGRTALASAFERSTCAAGLYHATVVVDRAGTVIAARLQGDDACIIAELKRARFEPSSEVRILVVRIAIR